MRAVYFPNLNYDIEDNISIKDEAFHHLVNVVRVRVGDEILLLDGLGQKIYGEVTEIKKKEVVSLVKKKEFVSRERGLDIIVGNCKREYLESILRMCVEVGAHQIALLKSEYSQANELRDDRVNKILVSALEQSNNPFMPSIHKLPSFNDLGSYSKKYDCVIWFNSRNLENRSLQKEQIQASQKTAILIGPEGGFSDREEQLMMSWKHFTEVHLPIPIMKAVTAVPAAVGYFMGLKDKNY
jgi:16S rRNA (uracil1498-N3)-methyltransferase